MIYFKEIQYPETIKSSKFLSLMTTTDSISYILTTSKYHINIKAESGNLRRITIRSFGPSNHVYYMFNKQKKVEVSSYIPNFKKSMYSDELICNAPLVYMPPSYKYNEVRQTFNDLNVLTYSDLVNLEEDFINFHFTIHNIPNIQIYPTIYDFIKEVRTDEYKN